MRGRPGRTDEGPGIGLAELQELVRLHGSEVRVQSEVGRGTTVTITIPLGRARLPDECVNARPSSATTTAIGAEAFSEEALRWLPAGGDAVLRLDTRPRGTAAESQRARVLIADDNSDMREHIVQLLSPSWEIEAVADGQAALEAARRRKPDLILTDVMMPHLDGLELLTAIRSDPGLIEVPVILLSGRAGIEACIEGLRAGADDYLAKPFFGSELIARVESALSLSRLRGNELAAMTRLHRLSMRLTATSDISLILNEVLDVTMQLQEADFGNIQLYDEATGTLRIVASRGLGQAFLDYLRSVDASDTLACSVALRSATRVIIEDVNADPAYLPHRPIAALTGYRAVQSTPLLDRWTGKPVGILSTHFREPTRPSIPNLHLTDLYARQAGDVIAFRLAEQRLRESEARLSAILNQVPGAVGLFDTEGRLLLRGGPLGGLWDDLIPSRDPASIARWRGFGAEGLPLPFADYPGARALRGEVVSPGVDFIHTGDDGRETWISVSAAPFRNEAGEIRGAVAILQNVDDQKHAEQRLREGEARLQAAVDLVKLGCYSWDPQTNALQWENALRAMWGLPENAPVDYDIWRAGIHPDDLAAVDAAAERCADPTGTGLYDVEYRVIRADDGVERWIATRGQTNFRNNKPVSFHGVALDITDRKRIENELERRVEQRTRELESVNQQLRSQVEQREAAEATVRQLQRLDAIGQITSGVAHDFNNLLSVVLTNARLLSRRVRDADDQEGIDLISTAAERGAKLVAQLLSFARQQRLEPQPIDLNGKITDVQGLLSVTLGGTIDLKVSLARHLWLALVDPTQIEMIVLNLAINARDAMPSGGTLIVETFNSVIESEPSRPEQPPPGDYVGLAITDTGLGIPDQVLPKVFEPFFTTKEPGKGSGLGLAQVFGFAKQSGGGVTIETRLGRGTSVKVFFPRAEMTVGDQDVDCLGTEQDVPAKGNPRVLVVDDDKAVLKSTLRMLEFLGYAAIPAGSGAEAIRLIGSDLEVALVLADVAMPEMDGVELHRAIHARWPGLPVVLVTGQGDLNLPEDLNDSHMLQKPYSEITLEAKIASALN